MTTPLQKRLHTLQLAGYTREKIIFIMNLTPKQFKKLAAAVEKKGKK